MGILACAISGTVTSNRFGFALEGSWCAFDRIYFDSLNGQLKNTYPKWVGFEYLSKNLTTLKEFIGKIQDVQDSDFENTYKNLKEAIIQKQEELKTNLILKKILNDTFFICSKYEKILDSVFQFTQFREDMEKNLNENINYFNLVKSDFEKDFKEELLNNYYYYAKIFKAFGKVLTMIYFCLLIIVSTFSAFSMMFYACLKRQGYLNIFMHVLWNIIRFFMFSFFIYGAAFGICWLFLKDAIAYVMFVFGKDNLENESYLLPKNKGKEFLQYCLLDDDNNYKNRLDKNLVYNFDNYFNSILELNTFLENYNYDTAMEFKEWDKLYTNIKTKLNEICGKDCLEFSIMANRNGGIFGSFDCSFLKSDLAMIYRTLYDLSIEARILCALSCCISFFGAIFVYFFLLVMHHYNTELFFDNGNNFITGFEGFGNTKKKQINDPSHKKRKLRAEVELSSINEEYGGFQDNKNED